MKKFATLSVVFFSVLTLTAQINFGGKGSDSFSAVQGTSDSIRPFLDIQSCGLNFITSSVVLGKRMEEYGLQTSSGQPLSGVPQPAELIVSGIPNDALITHAYMWWALSGNDSISNFSLTNPSGNNSSHNGILIGSDAIGCWGLGTSVFRADVLTSITGNGSYYISGLPTDSTFQLSDTDGATLYIIYKDSTNNKTARLVVYDGLIKVSQTTKSFNLTNLGIDTLTSDAKAFMLLSDLQNDISNSDVRFNNGPYVIPIKDFWDFELVNTTVVQGQNSSTFGVRAPNDCVNFMVAGLYYNKTMSTPSPVISQSGDTLSVTGNSVETHWLFNGNVTSSQNNEIIVSSSGNYHVISGNSNGCYSSTDTIFVDCLNLYQVPLTNTNDTIFAPDHFNSYSWTFNGNVVSDTLNYIVPSGGGSVVVNVIDSLACNYSSNNYMFEPAVVENMNLIESGIKLIFPNPFTDNVIIEVYSPGLIEVFSLDGKLSQTSYVVNRYEVNSKHLGSGLYILRYRNEITGKISYSKIVKR